MPNTSSPAEVADIEQPDTISTRQIFDKQYTPLPSSLNHIEEAIEEATCIISFKEDWDDNGANATDEKTYEKAVYFLTTYATDLLKYGIVAKPYIDVMRDGAVSIFWETKKATLLIIFTKNDSPLSYFYGEEKTKKIPFRYAIENGKETDEIVILWMSRNLI